jgi:hypothetical protein
MARSKDIKTPLGRFAYTQTLFKARASEEGSTPKFGCTILFPKNLDISKLKDAAAQAAIDEWGDKAKDMLKNGLIKSPFLDGDGPQGLSKKTGERLPGFEDHIFIRVTATLDYPPKVVAKDPHIPLTSANEFYSGCYGYAVVNAFTWDNKKNGKGITFGVSMVQFAKDGDKLGGGGPGDPTKMFDTIEDEGDAPAATKSGAGAAALFD